MLSSHLLKHNIKYAQARKMTYQRIPPKKWFDANFQYDRMHWWSLEDDIVYTRNPLKAYMIDDDTLRVYIIPPRTRIQTSEGYTISNENVINMLHTDDVILLIGEYNEMNKIIGRSITGSLLCLQHDSISKLKWCRGVNFFIYMDYSSE